MSIVEKAMRKRRAGSGARAAPETAPPPPQSTSPSSTAATDAAEHAAERFREAAGVAAETAETEALRPGFDATTAAADSAEPDGARAQSGAPEAAAVAADDDGTPASPAAPRPDRQGGQAAIARPPDLELQPSVLRAAGLWPAESESRRIEDQYRRIKRPLLASAFGINTERLPNGNLLMVASSLPGEGKSFTSFNLATSIANELERSVLLVDADVAKPHITRSLGLHERRGLIDLLQDPTLDPQEVILRTSIGAMRLLPSGPLHRHATELLASARMATLARELADRYPDRVIIFDTPPLLLTTEAQAMAHLMGQIVVVVHASHTPQSAVLQAIESLEGAQSISFVLNKTRAAWGEEYRGYGYY